MMGGEVANVEIHNLEFGVAVGGATTGEIPSKDDPIVPEDSRHRHEPGAVTVRANVADQIEHALVPGELWYKYHPEEFDTRRQPPRIQVDERLYYEPCARCGKAINDPLCRCGSASQFPAG
jgi:hypothetical protein